MDARLPWTVVRDLGSGTQDPNQFSPLPYSEFTGGIHGFSIALKRPPEILVGSSI